MLHSHLSNARSVEHKPIIWREKNKQNEIILICLQLLTGSRLMQIHPYSTMNLLHTELVCITRFGFVVSLFKFECIARDCHLLSLL